MRETEFIESCLGRASGGRQKFNLLAANLLLFTGFVEVATFVLHYHYLSMTPHFREVAQAAVDADAPHMHKAITRQQFCKTPIGVDAEGPHGLDSWYLSRKLVCHRNYEFIAASMDYFLPLAAALGALLFGFIAD